MSLSLPPKPNLEQLKKQAKDLLKSHRIGDVSVCEAFKLIHRYTKLTRRGILQTPMSLRDAQFAVALQYGFESWRALRECVESVETDKGGARITSADINRLTDHLIRQLKEEVKHQRGKVNIRIFRGAFRDHSDWVATNESEAFRRAFQCIEDGTFGICEECGENISFELLKDVPDESLCVKCTSGGRANTPGDLYCDFCGKNGKKVGTLIAGPAVYVCDECVQVCSEILAESKEGRVPPDSDSALYCSFCGKAQTTLIAGSSIYICDQCVHLCSEIVEKEPKSEGSYGRGKSMKASGSAVKRPIPGERRSPWPITHKGSETAMSIADIKRVVDQISREKGIDRDILIQALEGALKSAATKKYGTTVGFEVQYAEEADEIEVFQFKKVVENVADPELEISLEEGQELDRECRIGDSLRMKMDSLHLGGKNVREQH